MVCIRTVPKHRLPVSFTPLTCAIALGDIFGQEEVTGSQWVWGIYAP